MKDRLASTPFCAMCGHRIALQDDAILMLSGQFFWVQEENMSALVLEPGSELEVVTLPGTHHQYGVIVDPSVISPISAVHRECLGYFIEEDEDDEDEDEDMDSDHVAFRNAMHKEDW